MSQATGFQAWYNGDTAATNLTQTPVPHGLDFSYCSTAWTAAPTSSGSGKSNRLSSDAVAGIAAAILVFLFLAMAAARVSVLGFQDCRGKGESTLPFTSRDAGVEMN